MLGWGVGGHGACESAGTAGDGLILLVLVALLLAAAPVSAFADPAASLMAVRHRGCAGRPGVAAPLHRNRKLDKVARLLADGKTVRAASMEAGYRVKSVATLEIPGAAQDSLIEHAASGQLCSQVTDPEYTEIGTYRRGTVLWAVLALPFAPPGPRDALRIEQRVLELTNQARARGRQCGREPFGAAPPLKPSPLLSRVALEHSKDMAAHDLFDHTGSDGSSPGNRMTRAGYQWRMAGENIASGVTTADAVVAGWLESPHHCENIMRPRFTQMGIAYFYDPKSADGIYWTQEFGTPAK
jgi:uncharacterized protein YkwD